MFSQLVQLLMELCIQTNGCQMKTLVRSFCSCRPINKTKNIVELLVHETLSCHGFIQFMFLLEYLKNLIKLQWFNKEIVAGLV